MMEVKRKEVKKGVVATPFELLTESVTDPFVLYLCLLVFWFWLVAWCWAFIAEFPQIPTLGSGTKMIAEDKSLSSK